ncbi:glycosyltransferase family 9 protein [Methylophilaceae bacterium]|nr:glycosyltransferase family 9 protein [Methylophilaceae bacterium]
MNISGNILIIKHGALGDLIQADGIFKSIRSNHKDVKIFLLTSSNFFSLMETCPHIDDVLVDNRPSFLNVISYINLYEKIIKYDFKVIYDLQNSQRTYFYRKYLFNNIKWISTNRKHHPISSLRGLEEMMKENLISGNKILKPDLKWLSRDVKKILKTNDIKSKYILLLPGSSKNHPLKRWPYYSKLAKLLVLKGHEVVTILGPEEIEIENLMVGHILKNLDWHELSGVIEKSCFIVGNDSGPSHIASCLNKKGFALFGPSTSAKRSELKRGNFKTIEVSDLRLLSADAILKRMMKDLS